MSNEWIKTSIPVVCIERFYGALISALFWFRNRWWLINKIEQQCLDIVQPEISITVNIIGTFGTIANLACVLDVGDIEDFTRSALKYFLMNPAQKFLKKHKRKKYLQNCKYPNRLLLYCSTWLYRFYCYIHIQWVLHHQCRVYNHWLHLSKDCIANFQIELIAMYIHHLVGWWILCKQFAWFHNQVFRIH